MKAEFQEGKKMKPGDIVIHKLLKKKFIIIKKSSDESLGWFFNSSYTNKFGYIVRDENGNINEVYEHEIKVVKV